MFLKEARAKAKMTQQDVAVALGISVSAVVRWESGKCLPRRRDREALARVLGDESLVAKLSEFQRSA